MSATGCNPDFSFCLFLVWDYRELVTERRYFAGGGCFHWNLSLVGNTDGLNPMDEKKNEKIKINTINRVFGVVLSTFGIVVLVRNFLN